MANEFKIRKGLIVEGATSGTVVDVQGSLGQLFSVTDNLTGSIFSASDISGVPVFDVNSNGKSYFTGYVGIGVVNPLVTLHLNDPTGSILRLSSDQHTDNNKIEFDALNNGSIYHSIVSNTNSGNLQIRAGDGGSGHEVDIYTDGLFTATFSQDQKVGIGTSNPQSLLQTGIHTFTGGNGMYSNDRVGISNHGNLTGLMLASTYNDASFPEYGLVFVQGPSTASYNVWSISPDGPAKGTGLSFIYKPNTTNIHNQTPQVYMEGSTGHVGIGTTTPPVKFVVNNGVARTSTAKTYSTFVHTNDTDDFRVGLATAIKGGAASANRYISIEGASYQVSTDTFTNEDIDLVLNPVAGNVGIGTDSPRHLLQVGASTLTGSGSINTTAAFYGDYSDVYSQVGVYDNDATGIGVGGAIDFGGLPGATSSSPYPFGKIGAFKENATVGDYAGYLQLFTTSAGSNLDFARLSINSSGSIKFDYYNSTNLTGTPTYLLGTDASGNVVKTLGGAPSAGGGTTSQSKYYSSLTGSNNDFFPLFTITDSMGPVNCKIFTYAHDCLEFSVAEGYGPSNAGSISVINSVQTANGGYATVSAVRINQDGIVEIKLTFSSGPTVNIGVIITGYQVPNLVASLATGTSTVLTVDSVDVNVSGLLRSKQRLQVGGTSISDTTNTVSLNRTGNSWIKGNSADGLGVGTATPDEGDYGTIPPKFHVLGPGANGASSLVARFQAGGDANDTLASILINHSNDRGLLIEGGRGGLGTIPDDDAVSHLGLINSAGTLTRMITLRQSTATLSNSYNVGIGTITPDSKLDVRGTASGEIARFTTFNGSDSYIYIGRDDSTSEGLTLGYNSSNGDSTIKSVNGSHPIIFEQGTSERMRINSSGNVGISTTTPEEKLHVAGNIFAEKRVISANTNVVDQNLLTQLDIKISNQNDIYGNLTKVIISPYEAAYTSDGTGASTIRLDTQTAMTPGATHTFSVYYKDLVGSLGIDLYDQTAIGTYASAIGTAAAPTSGRLYGYATKSTTAPGNGYNFLDINLTNNGSVTLLNPKVETGKIPTDFIASTDTDGIPQTTTTNDLIATGKIGIQTNTPQKNLHVEGLGGASASQVLISSGSDTVGDTAGILLRAEGGESDSALRAKGAIFFERETSDYGTGKMHLAVNGAQTNVSATVADAALTIDDEKNVRTYAKLGIRVDGDAIPWRGFAQIPAVINLAGNGAVFTRPDVTYLSQNFYYNAGDIGAVIDAGKAGLIEVSAGEIKFLNTTAGASSNATISVIERMRIDTNGVIQFPQSGNTGFLNYNSQDLEFDVNRNPETGAFSDTAKSHGRISITGAAGGSTISFKTVALNNTVAITRMTVAADGAIAIVRKATSASTATSDSGTTLVTKDYVDSSAGIPSHFRQGVKTQSVGTAFSDVLTVGLAAHTGCYVTLCCFGDWGSHSTAAYRGEFFLQNGGSGYSEPGIIIRQDDNTSDGTDQIICQIVDPAGSAGVRNFVIQIRHTDTTSPASFTGTLTFTVQGQFNSVT